MRSRCPQAAGSPEAASALGPICIDGFNLAIPKGSGIATYGRNLITAIRATHASPQVLFGPSAARSSNDLENLAALADGPPPRSRVDKNRRWGRTLVSRFGRKAFAVPASDEIVWSATGGGRPDADLFWSAPDVFTLANRAFDKYGVMTPLAFEVGERPGPQIVHWTCPLPVYARDAVNIVTVHDLIPLRLPHTTLDDTFGYARKTRAALDRADHVVVISEQTRRDVIELMGVDESRITNTYQAVTLPSALMKRTEADVVNDVEQVIGLGWQSYFLYFGAVEPKKNLARLIEAHLASGVATPLVIVGGRGWLDADEDAFLDDISRGSRAGAVRRFGYMPFHLLISLIRGAKAVLFPSLYEGFGLPVLEAMLLGTPVLTTAKGSLREVAGEAALMVDPYDVDSIKSAIQSLEYDAGLRRTLREKGFAQAARFTPELYNARIQDLYQSLSR